LQSFDFVFFDFIVFLRYAQVWKNQLTLYVGRSGSMEKIGE